MGGSYGGGYGGGRDMHVSYSGKSFVSIQCPLPCFPCTNIFPLIPDISIDAVFPIEE